MVVFGAVFAVVFKKPVEEFFPYLCSGIMLWQLIASSSTECSKAFEGEAVGMLRTFPVPFSLLIIIPLIKANLTLALSLPVLLMTLIYFGALPQALSSMAQILLGYFSIVCFLLAFGYFLGIWCLLVPDLRPLVSTGIQIGFLVTPVLWPLDALPVGHWYLTGNIFYHLLESVRSPLLDNGISHISLAVNLLTSIGFFVAASLSFVLFKAKIFQGEHLFARRCRRSEEQR